MFLLTAGKYLSLTFIILKANILSAMEYRLSFIIQVLGMIVNDFGLILVWYIYFLKFPQVNGWGFQDTALLFSITTINFALVMIVARGAYNLSRYITNGELDYFLSLPQNTLWHLSISKSDISAIGDLLFGLIIFFFSGIVSLQSFATILAVCFFSAIAMYGFIIITQSLAFYFGNFEDGADQLFHGMLGFTLYPQTTYFGVLKLITLTILPAFFIAALPVRILHGFSWADFGILILFSFLILLISIITFQRGLKRYESGNLINVKL